MNVFLMFSGKQNIPKVNKALEGMETVTVCWWVLKNYKNSSLNLILILLKLNAKLSRSYRNIFDLEK